MSEAETSENLKLYLRLAGVAVLLLATGALGLWLGELSVPDTLPDMPAPAGENTPEAHPKDTGLFLPDPAAPPLFFHAGVFPEADWSLVLAEIEMAAKAGVHRFMLPVHAFSEAPDPAGALIEKLEAVTQRDEEAEFFLQVFLDPSSAWQEAHPAECFAPNDNRAAWASPASRRWRTDAEAAMTALLRRITDSEYGARMTGIVLCAFEDGMWKLEKSMDRTDAAGIGFQSWLKAVYGSDEELRALWNVEDAALETALIPETIHEGDTRQVFYTLPEMRPVVDYLQFTSDIMADALLSFTSRVKSEMASSFTVIAPYGYSFELLESHAGHFAFETLLESDLDGFISPVSYVDRGLGGAGGLMGPVNSAFLHEKDWYLIDDTRTGIYRDPKNGAITRLKGIRPEDKYNVQRRNFALSVIYGTGLVWSDPHGEGWLHDEAQWEEFGLLREIYADLRPAAFPGQPAFSEKQTGTLLAKGQGSGADTETATAETGSESAEDEEALQSEPLLVMKTSPPGESELVVVADEISRFYQRADTPLNRLVLHGVRDAALRAGLPVRFTLLSDVLAGRGEAAPVYLFANVFHLTETQREDLHARLAREKSCAIWLYAPGYISGSADTANVSAVTRMQCRRFEGTARSGSRFMLAGRWMAQEEEFGMPGEWDPLFYIEDDNADELAQYIDSGKCSVAVSVQEEGWTSIFVAEPAIGPPLLCELLRILEQHLYSRPGGRDFFDAAFVQSGGGVPQLLAIHARHAGEKIIDLARQLNARDLFDPEIGWLQKESFLLPLNNGETRFFRLSPR
jgi:hypothetical protein